MPRAVRLRLALVLVAALPAPAAGAHAFLDHADPAVGATIATSPTAIRLFFTESIEPKFSRIAVSSADGSPVKAGAVTTAQGDSSELDLALPTALSPGRYKVTWRVVGADTHHTEGTFSFEVSP